MVGSRGAARVGASMTATQASEVRQGDLHGALLVAGAFVVVGFGVRGLAAASPPRIATIVVSTALGGVALFAPPSRLQITSRVAGIAALAVVVATASLLVVDRAAPLDVDRLAGPSAVSTSVRVARAAFPSSTSVVVAGPDAPPGLVLSTALAREAPVLYVHGAAVHEDVIREIARLDAREAVAIAAGDTAVARLAAVGLDVEVLPPSAPAPSLELQLRLIEDPDHARTWVAADGHPADLVVAAAASFPDDGFAVWREGSAIGSPTRGATVLLVGGTAAIPAAADDD